MATCGNASLNHCAFGGLCRGVCAAVCSPLLCCFSFVLLLFCCFTSVSFCMFFKPLFWSAPGSAPYTYIYIYMYGVSQRPAPGSALGFVLKLSSVFLSFPWLAFSYLTLSHFCLFYIAFELSATALVTALAMRRVKNPKNRKEIQWNSTDLLVFVLF